MTRLRLGIAVGACMLQVATSGAAMAQEAATCTVAPSGFQAADVCRKVQDLFAFVAPQVGAAVVGGNHILGQGSAVGGAAARTFGFKVTTVSARVPKNAVALAPNVAAQSSDFGASSALLPLVSANVALGILPGIPMALTNVLGVDFLAGLTYLPPVEQGIFALEPKQAMAINYGIRVGLLQESALMPGLGVSYMRKQVPRFDILYTPENDTLRTNNTQLRAHSMRATVSKGYWLLGFVAGIGHDRIESITEAGAVINDGATRVTVSEPLVVQRISRNTAFLNASFGLRRARLTAEYGWSGGGKRDALNTFGGESINGGAQYGSLGVGFRF